MDKDSSGNLVAYTLLWLGLVVAMLILAWQVEKHSDHSVTCYPSSPYVSWCYRNNNPYGPPSPVIRSYYENE